MVLGDGWFMHNVHESILEPCRHCIGTGKEECTSCAKDEAARSITPTSQG
jgi:Ribonuclease G/E